MTTIVCAPCWAHYGDRGPCDEGRPANSPHRRGVPLPRAGEYRICEEGAVCAACGCWPHHPDCAGRVRHRREKDHAGRGAGAGRLAGEYLDRDGGPDEAGVVISCGDGLHERALALEWAGLREVLECAAARLRGGAR